jgi:hypothetical protein
MKPLLNFDDDKVPKLSPEARIPKSRSVFGVDTLWEREMVKLKEIENQEAEENRRREAEEAERERKKREKRKGKAKSDDMESIPSPVVELDAEPRVSAEPPVLPVIRNATLRQPHPPVDDDDDESDSDSGGDNPSRDHFSTGTGTGAEHWYNGSSDEADDGPRRTTGTGPRYLKSANRPSQMAPGDDDSDEDVPLAATFVRATQRANRIGLTRHDSDDEKPLSALIEKTKLNLPPIDFDAPADPKTDDDDDDDKPLGLRIPLSSHAPSSTSQHVDDDDRPLGFHPEHQRRTQYMMATQQHQNQMMMQAQMRSSVFFGPQPAMLGSGFFGQPMGAPMMIGPFPSPAMPSPPPVEDAAKFGRVDRWRHKVAVEGQM